MLEYVIKSGLCLIVLFSFYKLFMEGEYFHRIKRIYLIGSLIISILLPFITITYYTEVPMGEIGRAAVLNQIQSSSPAPELPLWHELLPTILFSIYIIGFLIFGFRFYRNLKDLISEAKTNDQLAELNYIYVLLGEKLDPYSFFNYIFLNKNDFRKNKISTVVIDHEKAHVDQKHSYDLLFVELLHVVFWFNPIFFLLKRSVKLNHEFLADESVLKKKFNPLEYSNILVQYSSGHHQNSFSSPISHSLIKKRIIMISKRFSLRRLLLRSVIFLPVFAGCIYLFNEEIVAKPVLENANPINAVSAILQEQEPMIKIKIEGEKIWINGKETKPEDLAQSIDKLTKDWSEDDLENASIHMNTKDTDPAFMEMLNKEFFETRLSKVSGRSILPPPPPLPPAAGQVSPPPPPPHPEHDKMVREEIDIEDMQEKREAISSKQVELRALEKKYRNDKTLSQSEREKVMREMERKQNEIERKHLEIEREQIINERKHQIPAPPAPPHKIYNKNKGQKIISVNEKNENGYHVKTIVSREDPDSKYPVNAIYYVNDKEVSRQSALAVIEAKEALQVDIRGTEDGKDIVRIYK